MNPFAMLYLRWPNRGNPTTGCQVTPISENSSDLGLLIETGEAQTVGGTEAPGQLSKYFLHFSKSGHLYASVFLKMVQLGFPTASCGGRDSNPGQ